MQLLGCATLFCAADVLKAIAAKALSARFHQEAHFQKMRDALTNVRNPCAVRQSCAQQLTRLAQSFLYKAVSRVRLPADAPPWQRMTRTACQRMCCIP